MKKVVLRLTKGADLYESVRQACIDNEIESGVVLSGVGCVTEARIRNAGGVKIEHIVEKMEIVSLN